MNFLLKLTPNQMLVSIFALAGLIAGLGSYAIYVSRAYSYLSEDPAVCVNCHVMAPYYQAWSKSSHALWTTCNDCHVPQDNLVSAYTFKAVDGLYHAAVFTVDGQPQVIRAREGSSAVILENCLRCHSPLVTEFTKMNVAYDQVLKGEGRACWDCHSQVPHTNISNLASAPGAIVPFPESPVPGWLSDLL
ncbi:MAG: cytochrome c nitrite reductase small subunit [Candidatus Adiutrix sp.]|jgi:cytochrome c nitrite reductase small subunit|nr:cytochrome c nitrite reductase small subunit [Candidatus Adiutrix sp.]